MLIIKRRGHKQEFDDKKLKMSIFAACLNAHIAHEEADIVADKVADKIKGWISREGREVTTDEIFGRVDRELQGVNEAAAFMYTTHRDIS